MPGGLFDLEKGYPEEKILNELSQPINGIAHVFPLETQTQIWKSYRIMDPIYSQSRPVGKFDVIPQLQRAAAFRLGK